MAINPNQLLKRLDPGVRSDHAGSRSRRPISPLEKQDFGEMMALVSHGQVRSGQPVEARLSQGEALDDSQLERLAAAADLAQAAGARTVLMLIDGRGLVMDVAERTVSAELQAGFETPVVHLDAAVYVAHPDEAGPQEALRPGSGLRGRDLIPPAIARQLEASTSAPSMSKQTLNK